MNFLVDTAFALYIAKGYTVTKIHSITINEIEEYSSEIGKLTVLL